MRTHLLYIIGVTVALLSSCHDDFSADAFLNGSEKTPLTACALIDGAGGVRSRAVDKDFETNDQLIAYLRHVTWNGTTEGVRTSVAADQAPQLVTFTKGSTAMTAYDGSDITPIGTGVALGLNSTNTKQTADLTASPLLYWDDFSNSASDATDLRTDGHYLQSFYGYCYNGGTPTTALTEATGALGWTVSADQHEGFKTSDLLWSAEQTPVAYAHATYNGGTAHGQLILPYTHAMSKVTVEVVCEDGFDANVANFANTSVVLKGMQTVASLTAPTGSITAVPGTDDANVKNITTQPIPHATTPNVRYSFAALIAPTLFADGKAFAEINNVDGNNYTLALSDAILNTEAANDWASRLTSYTAATGGTTQPGVNYLITVTIKKQDISVNAEIRDWDEVSATGIGVIQFAGDVTDKTGAIATELLANGFDLYKAIEVATPAYGKAATTYSYVDTDADDAPDTWKRTNEIYWPNATDRFFFRALSGATADDPDSPTNESLTMENGHDVLWGTTKAHSGTALDGSSYDYAKGAALNPRTGDVPLTFSHPMAKVTFKLLDENLDATLPDGVSATDYANPLNPRINLAGATIQIVDLATGGTLNLHDGSITPAEHTSGNKLFSEDLTSDPKRIGYYAASENGTETTYATDLTLRDYSVIPQTIGDGAMLIVTLADDTTYKTQLNTCTVTATASGTAIMHPVDAVINQWNRGVSYTYTILFSKEKITFRALIENWDKVEGGGKATLDWD